MNTRETVLEMLLEVTKGNVYSHVLIQNVLEKYDYLEAMEKAFMKRLFEGTLERMIQIDYILNSFSKVPVSKMKPVIRNILRMGVYQIVFMDAVPESAACNEAVKLAEKKKFHSLKGFVNGILRNVARNKENIVYPQKENDAKAYLSVTYSMPEWIVEKWLSQYGMETTEAILQGLLKEHEVSIRLSERLTKQEQDEWIEEIKKTNSQVEKHPYLPYAITISGSEGMRSIPGFVEGKWTVQDVSSMLVAEIAGVKKNAIIMDVCAAPGGKTTHIAEKLAGTGLVKASDISDKKVEKIRENVNRMRLTNVEVTVADALCYEASKKESADIVIADLPCSGLGIIGKKRDIKYNVTAEGLKSIVSLQKEILSVIHSYVKVGGTLIYSTCTINQEENEEMVKWFSKTQGFQLESITEYLPKELQKESTAKGYLQLLPGIDACDGFFMARFRKTEKARD